MPMDPQHEDGRPVMLVMTLQTDVFDHTRRSRIIDLGSIKRRLSLSLPRPTNLKRSLSFMARHTQDPPTTSTIISQPRSSRSPSLSFQLKNKPLVIPTRPLTSPRNSPPPDFLLDDDPFANLTGCRHGDALPKPTSPTRMGVRSSFPSIVSAAGSIPRPPHHSSPSSSLPHRPSPAHHRPAFKSRPSLPSLNTLAKINFVPGFGVRKVRKGKVGAGLPLEPWNDLGSRTNSSGDTSPVEEEDETIVETAGNPLPPLPSLVSVIESATSEHELADSKFHMSSRRPFPPPRSSSFSVPPSAPFSHTGVDMPPHSFSIAPSSLGLDAEVGAVYGSCDRSGKLRSSPRSPPGMSATSQVSFPSEPPPLNSSILPGMPPSNPAVDTVTNVISSPKETLEVGSHLALHDDDVYEDEDADQFMDQFMEHYEDDTSMQLQEGQEEVMRSFGKVDKKVAGGDEMQMQLPPQPWSSTPLQAATATSPVISLVDAASISSCETLSTSTTLTAFPRTSSPILASDDSSLLDSYSYTYPYPSSRQNGEMELKSSSVSIPSATDSTSATWSESASVSRSRSFSSTYTSLSFGSESETSSCPQSSVDGDDEVLISSTCRYSSGIQHHPLPLPSSQQPPMLLLKSSKDSVIHATTEVSVLGSPPALSMPFSGNEDTGYIVSVPGPGLIPNSPIHPISSGMELSTTTRDDDDTISTTTYLAYHDDEGDSDVHVAEEEKPHQASRHITAVTKFWMGQSEGKEEVLSSERCGDGIMRKKHDLSTEEVKTAVEATEYVEADIEWEYIIGNKPFAANNGKKLNDNVWEGTIAIVTPDAVLSDELVNDNTKILATTSRYSPPPPPLLPPLLSDTPSKMTLSTSSHGLLKDDLTTTTTTRGSSTALAKSSSWTTTTTPEPVEVPSTGKLNRSVLSHIDDEKRRKRTTAAALENRGVRRDLSSFLAISSGSSSSSSNDDDDDDVDHYGPVSPPLQSQAVVNVKQLSSRTPSSSSSSVIATPPPGCMTSPLKTPSAAVSRNNGSRFSENEDDDEEEEQDDDDDDDEDNEDEDDDIPLAQRIPGALTAQKSIRRQVRQEREKKKQEKILRVHAEATRTRLMTLRPGAVPSSSHDAQTTTTTTTQRNSRTLTRNGSRSLNPFPPEDLVRKNGVEASTTPVDAASLYQQQARHRSKSVTRSLRDVRPSSSTTETLPPLPIPQSRPLPPSSQRTKSVKEPSSSSLPYHYHTSPSPTPINSTYAPSSMTPLRPMRSFHFHRPSIDHRPIGMDDPRSVPLPLDAEKRISQNYTLVTTRSRPTTREGSQQQQQQLPSTFPTTTPTHHQRSLSRSRSSIERSSPTTISEPVPPIPATTRISHGSNNRISADADKQSKAPSRQLRPVPPPADPLPVVNSKSELVVQQRVFIGSMQRFNMVEIGASTTAGDVIEMIEAEGSLKDIAGSGGWMVFEVAQDFGMERPIRSFELVTDVQASWNKDKMVNYLVLRMTPLEVPLNRSAIPSSSPTHSGYVEWEAKRGKWCKRFIQLREHSLWISKRDTGYEQVHLCSLSNFDAYRITRTHRAPKPFAFAVKSTDNLSFFENTADYLHSFACSEKDGKIWMEKILVARSYVLFQERHVLFNPKIVNVSGNASGVSRSGTRKATIQRPHHDVFEPGSLLSKQL